LRVRLLLFVFLAAAPAFGLLYYTAYEQWDDAARDAQADAMNLVHTLSNEHERLIDSGRQLLIAGSKLPQLTGEDAAACNELLFNIMGESASFTSLTAARPDGAVFCSSARNPAAVNLSDREYFQQALKTRRFTVSDLILGRISRKPVVTLSY